MPGAPRGCRRRRRPLSGGGRRLSQDLLPRTRRIVMPHDPDRTIARYLASTFPHESRRSFLSRLTRALFALVGVEVAGHVAPFSPVASGADRPAKDNETW